MAKNLWVVDPIDGTINFAKQVPLFAFSLALVSRGELKVAVVHDPIKNMLLSAAEGQGAYENDKRLKVSTGAKQGLKLSSWIVGGIENSIFDNPNTEDKVKEVWRVARKTQNITTDDFPVAYALALVGSGDFDGTVSSIKTPWDVAAGSLIAKEAGAVITDFFGNPVRSWSKDAHGILAAPPAVHAYLLKILEPIAKEGR